MCLKCFTYSRRICILNCQRIWQVCQAGSLCAASVMAGMIAIPSLRILLLYILYTKYILSTKYIIYSFASAAPAQKNAAECFRRWRKARTSSLPPYIRTGRNIQWCMFIPLKKEVPFGERHAYAGRGRQEMPAAVLWRPTAKRIHIPGWYKIDKIYYVYYIYKIYKPQKKDVGPNTLSILYVK